MDEFADRHPSTVAILRGFTYGHLPERLQAISRPICEIAFDMARRLPDDPELVTGLRKLREAKDCLVLTRVLNED